MITEKEVKHIVQLAHLKLTGEEIKLFTEQLGNILQYFEKLEELDTEDVVPTAYSISVKNVMREDVVKKSLPREEGLKNAPDQKDGHFRVPPIAID